MFCPFLMFCQFFPVLSKFNTILELINGIPCDRLKLLRYFNDAAILEFSRIPFAADVLPINLVFYFKELKALVFSILALKLSTPTSA